MNNYLSLIKFSHTIFAIPFAIIGFLLAIHHPSFSFEWHLLLKVILCMVFARSAAMAFNRYIDKDIDKLNERTAVREIPAGVIKSKSALIFVIINCILFIATTKLINNLCFYLSPVAILIILGYSYTKRFTALCHFILGTGLALAPIGAYLAVTEQFDWLPIFYSFAVLLWVSGFDIIYALQDEDFDKSQQLLSIPVFMGTSKALQLSTILHLGTASFVIYAGIYASFGILYWIGAALFIGLLVYQHTLVKSGDLSKVNLAFFTTNGIASVVFAVFVAMELLL
ncbi:MAG: 4-hydroxybenzoate octaprenyltransferase [Bacteroidetes bacterium]|nr:UbiA family prenyltransferase [Bacteroidia bacterium]MBN4052266.1 UbiA family prenyltransferase [Sphingobacteriaceae bacterium AH-315-L07]PCH68095.1 MAG: 4-hydroxybenzoate octaprenyltransferase [Bacteroidota bacterium]